MSFELMKPIKSTHIGCMNCDRNFETLPNNFLIAVGFGYATVTKNGKTIYQEDDYSDGYWYLEDAEKEAIKDPDHDWRIHMVGPLSERHYQRQGTNNWVLYDEGPGFA